MKCAGAVLALALAGVSAAAEPGVAVQRAALDLASKLAGVPPAALVPDVRGFLPTGPGAPRPPAVLDALLAQPLQAGEQARALRAGFAGDIHSPSALLARAAGLYLQGPMSPLPQHASVPTSDDPLAAALQRLWQVSGEPLPATLPLPPDLPMHRPLRHAVAQMLRAVVDAEELRRQALASVPAAVTPERLAAQLMGDADDAQNEAVLRNAVGALKRQPLAAGLLRLGTAVEHLARTLPDLVGANGVAWRWTTPLGEVRIDTTGQDKLHLLHDPLLVVDVGGSDHYLMASRSPRNRIAVLLDIGGDDRYEAAAPGSDAAAGVLGYGIVWDQGGDDRYTGCWLAQGAAVFGGALLVDDGGRDHYRATGLAQSFALAGLALLVNRGGDDAYGAGTHAQGSAGPGGLAVLLDTDGNDRYRLEATPVVMRSSQLPDRNTSMGQGSGRGLRATAQSPALAGGVGLLVDLAGDDRYSAQVFAQGAGYYFGVGMLVDAGGSDLFEAAWYAQAAAAHAGAGVLLKEGLGSDHYRATHSTSLAAAHDLSLAYFQDDGGDDRYALGNLGLGAAQDASIALFVDAAGHDHYDSGGPPCQALGIARHSPEEPPSPSGVGLGLFLDLAGRDRYPAPCPQARDGHAWGGADTRAGVGVGIDAGDKGSADE